MLFLLLPSRENLDEDAIRIMATTARRSSSMSNAAAAAHGARVHSLCPQVTIMVSVPFKDRVMSADFFYFLLFCQLEH